MAKVHPTTTAGLLGGMSAPREFMCYTWKSTVRTGKICTIADMAGGSPTNSRFFDSLAPLGRID
jgi:hypothetical protein